MPLLRTSSALAVVTVSVGGRCKSAGLVSAQHGRYGLDDVQVLCNSCNMSAQDKIRVPVDLTPESVDRLDRLKAMVDGGSRSQVIRQALALYQWFVDQDRAGERLWKGKNRETAHQLIVLPWL